MSTPETNLETALDESNDRETRERAIDALQSANECDMLAEIAREDDVDDRYRELAVTNMAHPQCVDTLSGLVDDGELSDSLAEQARSLVEETPSDSGAGP